MDWLLIVIGIAGAPTMVSTTYPQCLAVIVLVQTQTDNPGRKAVCVGPKGEVITEVALPHPAPKKALPERKA